MANSCFTEITFYSANKEQITSLHQKIERILHAKPTKENEPDGGWMGNYANDFYPQFDNSDVDCRGQVLWVDCVKSYQQNDIFSFQIATETAWDAKIGLWEKIIEDFYDDVCISYISEECGTEYFLKWDPSGLFYKQRYYVDGCLPSKEEGDYIYLADVFDGCGVELSLAEIQEAIDKVSNLRYVHADNESELNENINAALSDIDDSELYFSIGKYEEVSPDEFDFFA